VSHCLSLNPWGLLVLGKGVLDMPGVRALATGLPKLLE